jgi:hypothetical protein
MPENINIVTMTLEEYKKTILELDRLKTLVATYKKKVEKDVENEIYESNINNIPTRGECYEWLNKPKSELIKKFSSGYSWRWESIAEQNYGVLTASQVEDMCVFLIKKMIGYRIDDLKPAEEEKKEGESAE